MHPEMLVFHATGTNSVSTPAYTTHPRIRTHSGIHTQMFEHMVLTGELLHNLSRGWPVVWWRVDEVVFTCVLRMVVIVVVVMPGVG